jgi:enoyl-CoA hydratase/carnithine racemase
MEEKSLETIIYEKQDHVAYIRFNQPEKLNAMGRQMTREMADVWVDFRDDDNLWVAILSAEGKSFCAGADVKEMERGKWKFRHSLLLGDEVILPWPYNVFKPVISAVQGHVYGAGFVMFLQTDIRIASEDARFGLPEGRVNVPFLLAPFIFDYMPRAIACELMLTGRPIDAKKAAEYALVNRVVPKDELMPTAKQIAEDVCRMGPLANFACKELYTRCADMDFQSALGLLEHIAEPVWNSQDSIEAKKAFIEKREPKWNLK